MDRPYLFPGPAKAFVLGLYNVAAQHGSLVDNGPRYVFIFCQRPEQYFLAGV